jgi:hypothetical protein
MLHDQNIRVESSCIRLAGMVGGSAMGGKAIAIVAVPRWRIIAIIFYIFVVICCKSYGVTAGVGVWGMAPTAAPVSVHKE